MINVQLVNPTLVFGLFPRSGAAEPNPGYWQAPAWVRKARGRLDQKLRYRHTLHELHQFDDRELEDLGLAPADLRALAWEHVKGKAPARA
jgi:uncharacterized protein YjiS (DUF1127 family)